ncbi:hypothetical protein AMELA_G00216620 [Ameiurus melas]|uniref:Reverse transcriptase n=1 Tax=Ameiurus melas TaxID=219545 RepID=A0A7J6A116_AMEME|nr:hypothetical protein AMELA_G00216620 [Ameiurus melas]
MTVRKTTHLLNDQVLCLTMVDVRKTQDRVNQQKPTRPDNNPGRVLRGCADQLADVFTDINISLHSAIVPMCFTATTIVPMPKKSSVSCLNDYRPIALTSITMKCFERLVMKHIKTVLPPHSLITILTAQRMMPSPLPYIWPSTTWTKRTPMFKCCS